MLILRALFILMLLVLAGFAANGLVDETGHVLFMWQGWTIETTAIVFFTIIAVLVLIGFYLGVMVEWFVELPRFISNTLYKRKEKTKFDLLGEGLEALIAGDKPLVKKAALTLKKDEETKQIARFITLMSGKTTPLEGDTTFLGVFSHMETARQKGNTAAVRQYAEQALSIRPESPKVELYLLEALLHDHMWEAALLRLPKTAKGCGWPTKKTEAKKAFIYLQQAMGEKNTEKALKLAEKALRAVPELSVAVLEKAQRQIILEKTNVAEKTLATFWKSAPRLDVFSLWMQVVQMQKNTKKEKLITKCEKLIKPLFEEKEHVAAAALCGARFYLRVGEAKKAKELAEKSVTNTPSCEGYQLLAEVDMAGAEKWLKKALAAQKFPQAQSTAFQTYQALSHKYLP